MKRNISQFTSAVAYHRRFTCSFIDDY